MYIKIFMIFMIVHVHLLGQELPEILSNSKISEENYLPDFSYAGYKYGEKELPSSKGKILYAADYGVISDDNLDDSKALLKAMDAANAIKEPVILQLPKGRIVLSAIITIERSNFVIRGTGTGSEGTEIYCPRPLMYMKDPDQLMELREYLLQFDKRQREPQNNIDLPFSQYAWAGGMFWTQIPGERVKSYLEKYAVPLVEKANVLKGDRGAHVLTVVDASELRIGDVLELQLYNTVGEKSQLIKDLYQDTPVKVGSHHWEFPTLPIVRQQVEILAIKGGSVKIKGPLTVEILPEYEAKLVEWKHLTEVGIENLRFTFPKEPRIAHHVERGYNAIYLTRVYNSWVKNIVITNADSGILGEEIANITITDISTDGDSMAHYTVAMAGVHNVLVENLKVFNTSEHGLSFNTFSTKNVFKNCMLFKNPVLDQHSGANHQNLFDHISVYLAPESDFSYPLFAGGGAAYWKPSHGAYSTFWNIEVNVLSGLDHSAPVLINGMKDGVAARVIGLYGNHEIRLNYAPHCYVEFLNKQIKNIPSLYDYQLHKRIIN
tara:strand:- start:14561 stop:16204 length:1644 start_codon:yes stop_codon:yes gene_type:complete